MAFLHDVEPILHFIVVFFELLVVSRHKHPSATFAIMTMFTIAQSCVGSWASGRAQRSTMRTPLFLHPTPSF